MPGCGPFDHVDVRVESWPRYAAARLSAVPAFSPYRWRHTLGTPHGRQRGGIVERGSSRTPSELGRRHAKRISEGTDMVLAECKPVLKAAYGRVRKARECGQLSQGQPTTQPYGTERSCRHSILVCSPPRNPAVSTESARVSHPLSRPSRDQRAFGVGRRATGSEPKFRGRDPRVMNPPYIPTHILRAVPPAGQAVFGANK